MQPLETRLTQLLERLPLGNDAIIALKQKLSAQGLSRALLDEVEQVIQQAIEDNKQALRAEVEAADQKLTEISQRLDKELNNIRELAKQAQRQATEDQDKAELERVRKQLKG